MNICGVRTSYECANQAEVTWKIFMFDVDFWDFINFEDEKGQLYPKMTRFNFLS